MRLFQRLPGGKEGKETEYVGLKISSPPSPLESSLFMCCMCTLVIYGKDSEVSLLRSKTQRIEDNRTGSLWDVDGPQQRFVSRECGVLQLGAWCAWLGGHKRRKER